VTSIRSAALRAQRSRPLDPERRGPRRAVVATLIPSDLFRLSGYLYVRPPSDDKARKPAAIGLAGSDAPRTNGGPFRMNRLEPKTARYAPAEGDPLLTAAFVAQPARLAARHFLGLCIASTRAQLRLGLSTTEHWRRYFVARRIHLVAHHVHHDAGDRDVHPDRPRPARDSPMLLKIAAQRAP